MCGFKLSYIITFLKDISAINISQMADYSYWDRAGKDYKFTGICISHCFDITAICVTYFYSLVCKSTLSEQEFHAYMWLLTLIVNC